MSINRFIYAASMLTLLLPQSYSMAGESRALLRVAGIYADYPAAPAFYTDSQARGVFEEARLLLDGELSEAWHYEFNLQQTFVSRSLQVVRSSGPGVERSAALLQSFSQDDIQELEVDRLNARYTHGVYDIRIGRQPINLATTFYFSPNDLFAPFAAQRFYRDYKPGVDALRADISTGSLTQFSFIGVLGYQPDSNNDNGWSDAPDTRRSSMLLHTTTVWYDVEWKAMFGRVREKHVVGLAASGELGNGPAIRSEVQLLEDRQSGQRDHEFVLGLGYRFANSLDLDAEWFYHGQGATSVAGYSSLLASAMTAYAGRRYAALSARYEFSPLLSGTALWLQNLTDHSRLYSLNAVYSLADEAELDIGLVIPQGRAPIGAVLQSEYGLLPRQLSIEYRQYF